MTDLLQSLLAYGLVAGALVYVSRGWVMKYVMRKPAAPASGCGSCSSGGCDACPANPAGPSLRP